MRREASRQPPLRMWWKAFHGAQTVKLELARLSVQPLPASHASSMYSAEHSCTSSSDCSASTAKPAAASPEARAHSAIARSNAGERATALLKRLGPGAKPATTRATASRKTGQEWGSFFLFREQ